MRMRSVILGVCESFIVKSEFIILVVGLRSIIHWIVWRGAAWLGFVARNKIMAA